MTPIKSLVPLAKWFLRIAAACIVYLAHFNKVINFSFKGLDYFVGLAFVVLIVLLIIGGFQRSARLTVISGLLIIITCLIQLFGVQSLTLNNLIGIFPLAAIGFYFMARGNNG